MKAPGHKVYEPQRGFLCRDGRFTKNEDEASLFTDFAPVVQLCLRLGVTSIVFIVYNGTTRTEWPFSF